uniref:Fibronectin leucine rich transmembrane 3 n=1 Tax=Petromyzon marinus TaxID=7757 RepID=S4RB90_PETMA
AASPPAVRLAAAVAMAAALALATPPAPASGCPAPCRCDGAFVYCNDRALTSVPSGIPREATTLFLQNNLINDAGIPSELTHLRDVDTVYLYGNRLEEFPTNLPPGVRELHLQENRVRVVPRAALARLAALERLHLDDNVVTSVGVERGAFAGAAGLKVLFLSRNLLSAVPIGLPRGLEELRLDDNRVGAISEQALGGLGNLKRLFLEGNQLSEKSIAERAFRDLDSLAELSLARNAFAAVPANLPGTRLERLYLQDNRISRVSAGALAGLRQLARLDLSGNSLGVLPQGVFDDLSQLAQLSVRNNPWRCTCALLWLQEWMKRRSSVTMVRGMVCQAPETARGTPLEGLALDCRASIKVSVGNFRYVVPLNGAHPARDEF